MVSVAVDYEGREVVIGLDSKYSYMLEDAQVALRKTTCQAKLMAKGSIKKLIGHTLAWEDEPVELEEKM